MRAGAGPAGAEINPSEAPATAPRAVEATGAARDAVPAVPFRPPPEDVKRFRGPRQSRLMAAVLIALFAVTTLACLTSLALQVRRFGFTSALSSPAAMPLLVIVGVPIVMALRSALRRGDREATPGETTVELTPGG